MARAIRGVSPVAKFDAAVAALLLATVLGYVLLEQRHSTDDEMVVEIPAPSASASAAPVIAELPAGNLEAGTYRASRGSGTFSLTVPDGWTASRTGFVVSKDDTQERN